MVKEFLGWSTNLGYGHGEMIAEGAAWELRGNDLIKRVYLGEAIPDEKAPAVW
ncbi:MAG: hypothetical protein Q8O52_27020 [Sulfuritalea sp.]|nr:hypothetical protein [Sulfuritalea sp.]